MINHLKTILFLFTSIYFSSSVYSNPPNSEEDLLYTTLKITCKAKVKNNTGPGFIDITKSGTGFIFDFKEKQVSNIQPSFRVLSSADQYYEVVENPYLVTNKHVIKDAISGVLNFHFTDRTNGAYTIGTPTSPFQNGFIPHDNADLCAMPLHGIIGQVNTSINPITDWHQQTKQQKKVFYHSLNFNHLVNFQNEKAIQDILMVGYPIGISDDVNNFPIVRKGITSSHLRTDFQGKPEVLIDAACFPGSSGSPVFLCQSPGSNFFRAKLLGTFWGGPQYTANGNIVCNDNTIGCEEIPTTYTATRIPANLGFVIKSTELMKLQEKIFQ